jgi:hypothetical protein
MLKTFTTNNNNMHKKLLLFLSYISLSSQFNMTPRFLLPFQNNRTTQYYPSLTLNDEYEITTKRTNCNDALTIFKIWATITVFTFPIISFPFHKEN